jgi:hypothetical protein
MSDAEHGVRIIVFDEHDVRVDLGRFCVLGATVITERILAREQRPELFKITATITVAERDTGSPVNVKADAQLTREELESHDGPPEEVIRLRAKALLLDLLDHEIDECLRVQGLEWNDPHVWRPVVIDDETQKRFPRAWTSFFGAKPSTRVDTRLRDAAQQVIDLLDRWKSVPASIAAEDAWERAIAELREALR